MFNCGVYKIENVLNGDAYIGQSIDIPHRIRYHSRNLKIGSHYNIHLQRAFNKYGEKNFIFEPVLFCEKKELTRYEQFFVDSIGSYNICKECVESTKGLKMSDDAKAKMFKNRVFPRGKDHHLYGKKMPREWVEKAMKNRKYNYGKDHPMYGRRGKDSPIFGSHISIDKKRKDASSKYLGVSFHKKSKKWRSRITIDGKTIDIGKFEKEIEAAFAYNLVVDMLNDDRFFLNDFEDKDLEYLKTNFKKKYIRDREFGYKKLCRSSRFIGVDFQKSCGKWRSRIRKDNVSIQIGMFSNEMDAALAYDKVAEEMYGESAKLNRTFLMEVHNVTL
jgi:group I intron endonuclease